MPEETAMASRNPKPTNLKLSAEDQKERKFEIEVYPVLQKWALVVVQLPERNVITEDTFPDRLQAVRRAYDFQSIIKTREETAEVGRDTP
jgi:hypothetical protein